MNETTAEITASPAAQTFEIPQDPKANLEWRKTGELPAVKREATPKEDSTPSKNASGEQSPETAAASATAPKQEKAKSESATRLDEILADLKRAGLSPAELKTFKREAAAAKATPETTVKPPAAHLFLDAAEKPVKPTMQDKKADGTLKFAGWEEFDEAKDQYHEEMAAYKAKLAVLGDRQERAAEAQQQRLAAKLSDARTRYGDHTDGTIGEATRAIMSPETGVPPLIQQFLNESPVLVDAMYVMGSKDGDVAAFIELARTDPGAALRKFALIEHLVEQELAGAKTTDKPADKAQRGEDGKLVAGQSDTADKTPVNKKPPAPPPPEELNTRGSAPSDAIATAVKNNDFASFKATEDRLDLARRRGA